MICCENTYNLCEYSTCDTISFGVASSTSTIKMYATFAGITQTQDIIINAGQPYIIDLGALNENACYTIRFKNLDGTKHLIDINGTYYDCFKLKTIIENENI